MPTNDNHETVGTVIHHSPQPVKYEAPKSPTKSVMPETMEFKMPPARRKTMGIQHGADLDGNPVSQYANLKQASRKAGGGSGMVAALLANDSSNNKDSSFLDNINQRDDDGFGDWAKKQEKTQVQRANSTMPEFFNK